MSGEAARRILVVSADETVLGLLGRLIEEAKGLALCGSASETSAVSEARRTRPDLIVLDADPSGADGASVLLSKLSLACEAALVVVSSTAWPGTKETESLLDAGACAVYPKPSGRSGLGLAGSSGAAYVERWLQIELQHSAEGSGGRG